MQQKINTAYSMFGIVKRNFINMDKKKFYYLRQVNEVNGGDNVFVRCVCVCLCVCVCAAAGHGS